MSRRKKAVVVDQEEETGTALTNYEDEMAAMANASAANESGGGDSVLKVQGGVLQYMGEPVEGNELELIVLGSSGEHTYYDTPYDPDRIVPPTCFSVFDLDDEPVPGEEVEEPENDRCGTCWAHKFKSAENGRGRACGVRRRLAVIPADALDNGSDGLEDADIAMFKVPPTSVQNWGKYVNTLAAKYQRPSFMVVTLMKVSPHPKFQFEVTFEAIESIESEYFGQLRGMHEGVSGMLLQPFDLSIGDEEEEEEQELKTDPKPARKQTAKKKVAKKKTSRRRA